MRLFYSLAMHLALPLVLYRLKKRAKSAPAYLVRWQERFGRYGGRFSEQSPLLGSPNQPLWVHAVSVGETVAIAPFINQLLAGSATQTVVMTTMTPTGAEQVANRFKKWIDQGRLVHVYCPYDYPWAYRRFLKQFAPSACLLVETELWPNLIHTCNQRSVPVIVANARLSEKSAKGYGKFAWLTKPMLSGVTHIAAQDEDSAQRFIALGAAASTVSVMGSVKYDLEISDGLDAAGKALREVWGRDRKVVIAASTHEGEEAQVIKAFKALKSEYPTLLLVVVPRHPERFDHVAELLVEEGLNCVRRSQTSTSVRHLEKTVDVYLGDTMGELMTLYAASDIAIIGGSLIERGGHNPLESAALGKPTIIGESTYNFAEVCHTLQSAGGLAILSDNTHLSAEISKLLSGAGYAKNLGDAGAQVVANNKGALARLLKRVEPYLS